jgi:glycosyltransferase involved in cell wall biosynthesis
MLPISIVVPAFNEEALITRCLHSIIAEFSNTEYELIVVDNGSTDHTAELAESAGATVLYQPLKGVTRARQLGLEAAKYEIVVFIDADNVLPYGWLNQAMSAMKFDVVVASGPIFYLGFGLFKTIVTSLFYSMGSLLNRWFPMVQGGNFILRRSALNSIGGFDTSIDFYGEDTDTACRLSKVGKVEFSFDMWAYSSPRRADSEGLYVMGAKYLTNFFWVHLFGHPLTEVSRDIRPK